MAGARRGWRRFVGATAVGAGALVSLAQLGPAPAAAPGPPGLRGSSLQVELIPAALEAASGVPADRRIASEIRSTVTSAIQEFKSMDAPAVLSHVSEAYRTGPLTKHLIRQQLAAMFRVYDAVDARVRIDDVRLVGDQAWIYSTGEVYGRVRWVGTWTQALSWERELEVARREQGVWKLFGYQQ